MFWHDYAKTLRHASQNAITEGDFQCILARNCEDNEQLRSFIQKTPSPTHPSIKKGVKKINRIVEKSNDLLIF